ncbi:AAA family ATPase [Oceanivirga salmonicida]|uniref:AAA family ATPase n=2 Tax=Oceanivirga salmonicida TaxID=1769291 RepID=UPI0012E2C2E8|nr:AAA family ATPase [Oceanivirga salmonicida]
MNIEFKTSFSIGSIRKETFYVDKTMLIDKLINNYGDPINETVLICRPRRFGKTLGLDTINFFFNKNKKEKALEFFNDKKIAKTEKMKYIGTRPVIHLDFKNKEAKSLDEVKYAIQKLLRAYFLDIKNKELSDKIKERVFDILDNKEKSSELSESLQILTEAIHEVEGIKPILLIDEYDSFVIDMLDKDELPEVISFFRTLFGTALKGNPDLHFAVLVGITELTANSIFSALNNKVISNVLDKEEEKFTDLFGFTQEEVDYWLEKLDLMSERERLKEYYDGYRIGNKEIYNPNSVSRALDILTVNRNATLKSYWVATGSNSIMENILSNYFDTSSLSKELFNLINGELVEAKVQKEFTSKNLNNSEAFYTFLLYAGYLTAEQVAGNKISVRVPNKEIKDAMQDMASEILNTAKNEKYLALKEAVDRFDIELIQEAFQDILKQVYAKDIKTYERAYRTLIATLFNLSGYYIAKVEQKAGIGEADIILLPAYMTRQAKLIELKCVDTPKDIENKHKEAKEQIEAKKYKDYFTDEQLEGLQIYTMVCCNYEVSIREVK